MNSAVSESPRPGRTDMSLGMGLLPDLAAFRCAIAIIARAVEVESRYFAIPAAMPRHAGDLLPRLAISV
jgi:hypothetical protein